MSEGIFKPSGQGRAFQFGPIPVRVVVEQLDTDDAFALVEATFPAHLPGPPLHRHPWQESFYILSGELEFTIGDDVVRATTGDFVHAGAGVAHTYANPGPEAASALGLFAPARFLAALEDIASAFPAAGSPDSGTLRAIYSKWGAEILA